MNIIGLDVTHSTTHMLLHSKFMCPHLLYHSRNSFTCASVRACLSVEIQQLQNSSVSARRSINPKIRLYVLPFATYKYEFRWKSDRKFVGKSMPCINTVRRSRLSVIFCSIVVWDVFRKWTPSGSKNYQLLGVRVWNVRILYVY